MLGSCHVFPRADIVGLFLLSKKIVDVTTKTAKLVNPPSVFKGFTTQAACPTIQIDVSVISGHAVTLDVHDSKLYDLLTV